MKDRIVVVTGANSGSYFDHNQKRQPGSGRSRDEGLAGRLWSETERLIAEAT